MRGEVKVAGLKCERRRIAKEMTTTGGSTNIGRFGVGCADHAEASRLWRRKHQQNRRSNYDSRSSKKFSDASERVTR